MRLEDLPTSVLCEVLSRFEAQELMTLACTCKLFHQVATTDITDGFWMRLYKLHYGFDVEPDPECGWKGRYRDAFLRTKLIRQRSEQRRVTLIENQIKDIEREVRTLHEEALDLKHQVRSHASLYREIDRVKSAEVALKTWSPASVSARHKQVVEQTPVDKATRLCCVRQEIEVSKHLLKSVLLRLENKKRKLGALEETLTASRAR
ncbi:hypothetical protein HOP50_01g04040 [Chloropicon primus]|uniref:F-box domain-containing protein n=1 Tax=Chloropicon primus TaxID=1764295 RepID=A0A5B8MBU5_9CHLO|nr:hypothetical protein A3770_01p04160 [Chloropicon primus]UPQ97113.1 hypothetical protein HOP50_01g04040 [Chloropicon primus]|mmetsp:Transcript_3163/g.8741  ORF Transcript_3163/g.8741 Transcript_3163/m.8741 type:complete len:206 (-) Transcript_3163:1673-2290(-)|eukprot:QDZ17898.1 hypothetical protein A3770_01p04160 [Chloropicon primus]